MDFIKHKTARDVLKLLRRIDNGDTLTEDVLQNLNRIATADFSGIRLTSLPESICKLTQLTKLDISYNQLTSLPESICKLTQLTYLGLSRLKLQEVPRFIQQLSKLESLDLSCNPLKTLPDWLGDMSKLYLLDLSELRLTAFPCSLLKLNLPFITDTNSRFNFGYIYIKDTRLSIQPISLFDQSRDKSFHSQESRKLIEDYFETPKDPVREAKVIFLGDGKVGKTYTIQRLLHDCQKGNYPTKQTCGILMEDLYAEKNGKSYKIRIWDFGGQEIMHEMHRCFLTDRTCYVVMVDTRANNQTGRARYWLRTIQNIAPETPVLLLVNEISGGWNRDLDYSVLKWEFPNLTGVEYCSSMDASDKDFRQKVEHAIFEQALDMDSCKMELPKNWEMVRQNLLNLQNNPDPEQKNMYYIDRQMFHNLCDRYGVPADNGLRAWLLTWFNDLGVCFSYHLDKNGQEQSADYKILEPMWLTSAVYKIIWEKGRTDDGLISLSEICHILEKPGSNAMKKDGIPCLENVSYTKEECNYILDIMRMFRISYPADANTESMPTPCNPDSKFDEQQDKKSLVAALERSNDLRKKEIDVIQKHTDAIKENTSVLRENTLSIQQVNELLYAIRDGRIELPENLMAALIESFRQCDKPTLQTAGQKMQRLSWRERGQMLREFLGDAANLTTVAPVLIKLGINYGPALLKLIVTAVPI